MKQMIIKRKNLLRIILVNTTGVNPTEISVKILEAIKIKISIWTKINIKNLNMSVNVSGTADKAETTRTVNRQRTKNIRCEMYLLWSIKSAIPNLSI
jgi:hypothetical protein